VALEPPHTSAESPGRSSDDEQAVGSNNEGAASSVDEEAPEVVDDQEDPYNPYDLPLRTHGEFLQQARRVEQAPSKAEAERRAKKCGIKGVPLLACLPSMALPQSFPLDFMHLIYENLFKNLLLLWTSNFKLVDHNRQPYVTKPAVWEAIGKATAQAAKCIPSAFGPRLQNIAEEHFQYTADALVFWHLYLGPVYLQRQFEDEAYFDHFIELIRLVHLCIQFEISKAQCYGSRTRAPKSRREGRRSVSEIRDQRGYRNY
jgi:hypothetical protein